MELLITIIKATRTTVHEPKTKMRIPPGNAPSFGQGALLKKKHNKYNIHNIEKRARSV